MQFPTAFCALQAEGLQPLYEHVFGEWQKVKRDDMADIKEQIKGGRTEEEVGRLRFLSTWIKVCVCVCVCAYVYICIYLHVCVRVYMCEIHTHMNTHAHTHPHTHAHTHTHKHTHTHTHTHTRTHAHTHKHTHTHTHTRRCVTPTATPWERRKLRSKESPEVSSILWTTCRPTGSGLSGVLSLFHSGTVRYSVPFWDCGMQT